MLSFTLVNCASCTLLLFRHNFAKDFVWMKRLHLYLLHDTFFSSFSQSTFLLTFSTVLHFGKPSWAVCSFSGTLTTVSNKSWYQEVVLWYTLTKHVYGKESRECNAVNLARKKYLYIRACWKGIFRHHLAACPFYPAWSMRIEMCGSD